jgi:hypothetical protein
MRCITWEEVLKEPGQDGSGSQGGRDPLDHHGVVSLHWSILIAFHQIIHSLSDKGLIFCVQQIAKESSENIRREDRSIHPVGMIVQRNVPDGVSEPTNLI